MRIFISYRRDDTGGHAGRLLDTLRRTLPHPVFMDVDGIEAAEDFFAIIEREIARSDVLLAVIGQQWMGVADRPRRVADPSRRRRIDDPQDYVRREIELALDAGLDVVPVLVGSAAMPAAALLPNGLRPLARLQAVEVHDHRWAPDVEQLVGLLKQRARNRSTRAVADAGTTRIRASVPLPLRSGDDDPARLVVIGSTIVVSSPKRHRIWSIGVDEERVLASVRLKRAPYWTPGALAGDRSSLWVADRFGHAVWRLPLHSRYPESMPMLEDDAQESGEVDDDEDDEPFTAEFSRPTWATTRRTHVGFPVGDLSHDGFSLWVTTPETPQHQVRWAVALPELAPARLATAGELLRINTWSRRVMARLPIPSLRRVAVGEGSVWVTALDVVARIDPERNMVAQVVPLEFEPGAVAVGDDAVWVASRQGGTDSQPRRFPAHNWLLSNSWIARIDALTGEFVGAVEVPNGSVHCLALGAGSLWAGAGNILYRIDPRSHAILESVRLSSSGAITDIVVVGTLVCVAVASERYWSSGDTFVALLDTAGSG